MPDKIPGKKVAMSSVLVALAALSVSLQFTPGDSGRDAGAGADTHERKIRLAKPQKTDASRDAGTHFKYDLKAQKEGMIKPKSGPPLKANQQNLNMQKK